MAGNKYLIADRSKLLKSKLDLLSSKLQKSLKSGELQTKEAFLFEAIKVLNEFYRSMNDPKLQVGLVRADDYPDPSIYNQLWSDLLDDLTIIFQEMENIESLTIANFNFVTTEANRLVTRIKNVASKLSDYALFATDAAAQAIYFKDSFNDISKIENNSTLLNATQCEINQAEGILTLPVNKDKDPTVIISTPPIINSQSNGTIGNNQETGAVWNGDVLAILDGNPDTWFEYERVLVPSNDKQEELVLDLTINLGESRIINHIRLNPNNFGTRTVVQIEEIETSLDGEVYTSIKDDIPIAGFATVDEENTFILAPSTSKYAGQGIYTFTPRKVKYVHLILKQAEPYIIETSVGQRNRYAIGIRDIDIQALTYKPEGEIVSTTFDSTDEIKKVVLSTTQNPSEESDLVEIRFYLTPDEGSTWHEIAPKNISQGVYRIAGGNAFESGVVVERIPELLNFNTTDNEAIITSVPVTKLRLKALLKRDNTAFEEGSYALQKYILTANEVHQAPKGSPFIINLERAPVNETVVLVDPMYGSRGDASAPYSIGFEKLEGQHFKYRLPFKKLPRPIKKELSSGIYRTIESTADGWAHVEVAGEEWTHATQSFSGYGGSDKVFILDVNTGELQFGNGTNGAAPPAQSKIDLYFDAERIFPSEKDDDHIAKLEFSTSANKDAFTVKRYDKIKNATELVNRNATVIILQNQNITDDGVDTIEDLFTSPTYGKNSVKTFVNGRDELTNTNDWTIDRIRGIIYLRTPLSSSDVVITYSYQPVYPLSSDEWDWATETVLRDSISIKDAAWKTIAVKNETVGHDGTYDSVGVELAHLSVTKGTLEISATNAFGANLDDADNPFRKEVDFIDGKSELNLYLQKTSQTLSSVSAGIQQISFTEKITSDVYPVIFSNSSLFSTRVTLEADVSASTGNYYIDTTNNRVKVNADADYDDAGTVLYWHNPTSYTSEGLYSVDYKKGIVYTQRVVANTYIVTASYEYTDYRAEYRIARLVDPKNYKVDILARKITIKDEEVFQRASLPYRRPDGVSAQYLVSYDYVAETREDVQDLKDYFSPILKDYALKIITKGRLL